VEREVGRRERLEEGMERSLLKDLDKIFGNVARYRPTSLHPSPVQNANKHTVKPRWKRVQSNVTTISSSNQNASKNQSASSTISINPLNRAK
jgi:hypothetical protein